MCTYLEHIVFILGNIMGTICAYYGYNVHNVCLICAHYAHNMRLSPSEMGCVPVLQQYWRGYCRSERCFIKGGDGACILVSGCIYHAYVQSTNHGAKAKNQSASCHNITSIHCVHPIPSKYTKIVTCGRALCVYLLPSVCCTKLKQPLVTKL